jgi:hypothetical protein
MWNIAKPGFDFEVGTGDGSVLRVCGLEINNHKRETAHADLATGRMVEAERFFTWRRG